MFSPGDFFIVASHIMAVTAAAPPCGPARRVAAVIRLPWASSLSSRSKRDRPEPNTTQTQLVVWHCLAEWLNIYLVWCVFAVT